MAKKKKQLSRAETRDKAKAYDTQYMGEEPEFEGVTFSDETERRITKIHSLNWYNYFKPETISYRKDVRKWLKKNRKDIDEGVVALYIKNVTACRLMTMALGGWELSESELNTIDGAINDAITDHDRSQADPEAEDPKARKPRVTPLPKMLGALDDWEDRQIEDDVFSNFDLKGLHVEFNDSKASLEKYARPWIEGRLNDLTDHWDKDAYPFGVKERNFLIKTYKAMLKDLDEVAQPKKPVRKKRKPTKGSQAKGFVCLDKSEEFNAESLPPIKIIGAERVYLFNEKYRTLTELVALPGGFSGKGMAITNVDMEKSRSTRLRKPLDMLPKVCKNAPRTINKAWTELTTKTTEANPRLNRNTVILRIL